MFLVWQIIFHWKLLLAIFFVSEEKIWESTNLLKSDYVAKAFFSFYDWYFYFSLIVPFILTYLVIWIFPKWIFIPAFRKEEEYITEKKRIRITEQKKIETAEKEEAEEKIKKLDVIVEKTKKEKVVEQLDPTIGWMKEYEVLKDTRYYAEFYRVLESIYEHGGQVGWWQNNIWMGISKELLAYLHTNNLITTE